MLQTARLAPKVLGDAAELVTDFLKGLAAPSGGYVDRSGNPDLYYSVFAYDALVALNAPINRDHEIAYLTSFADGKDLDFVHAACLARGWAAIVDSATEIPCRDALLARVATCRTPDGGFNTHPSMDTGTVYAAFLALGMYQDLGAPMPDEQALLANLESLRTWDGGYANQTGMPLGLLPSTAAAVALRRELGDKPEVEIGAWILERTHPDGGFFATPFAPIPDLLSTATALHALAYLDTDISPIREGCLDFIDSLWVNRGAFCGSWTDDALDCEYTYYALLALGHLSE